MSPDTTYACTAFPVTDVSGLVPMSTLLLIDGIVGVDWIVGGVGLPPPPEPPFTCDNIDLALPIAPNTAAICVA